MGGTFQDVVGGPRASLCKPRILNITFLCSLRWCAPHQGRGNPTEEQAEGLWTAADGGDPAHLPDHRLRDGLGTCRHLDTLLPLLPPRVSQNVVLVRAQLEGVRDLHCCDQIRPENLHQEKTSLRAQLQHREGVLGKLPPRDCTGGACTTNGVAAGCQIKPLQGKFRAGEHGNRQGLPSSQGVARAQALQLQPLQGPPHWAVRKSSHRV